MADSGRDGMVSRVPLVVVLGSTGVGKSKLGIQLAKKFNGEVISADSMQVYRGLDVITNKVTSEETEGVPHHMMDFLNPLSKYTVVDYRNQALPIIKRLLGEGKMPVVVGGTNYYIESLLWKVLVEEPTSSTQLVGDARTVESRLGIDMTLEPSQRVKLEGMYVSTTLDYALTGFTKFLQININASHGPLKNGDRGDKLLEEIERVTVVEGDLVEATVSLGKSLEVEQASSLTKGMLPGRPLPQLRQDNAFQKLKDANQAIADRLAELNNFQAAQVLTEVVSWSSAIEKGVIFLWGGKANLLSYRLHHQLTLLDPEMAASLHPNNTRKVVRSLEVLVQKGRSHSSILEEQRSQEGGSYLGGPLRFTNSIIFWLQCKPEVLNKRLDDRVEDMMNRGLIQELIDFHEKYNASRIDEGNAAYTEGIFQSIGFKEFHQYLILSEEERNTEMGKKLLEEGVEALKLVTRRYARKQAKWVTNRLLKASDRQVPPVMELDTTDPASWDKNVLDRACSALTEVPSSSGSQPPVPSTSSSGMASKLRYAAPTTHHCKVCRRIFIGDLQWEAHLKSKKHKAMAKKERL